MKHNKIYILKIWFEEKFDILLEMKSHQIWCSGVLLEMTLQFLTDNVALTRHHKFLKRKKY